MITLHFLDSVFVLTIKKLLGYIFIYLIVVFMAMFFQNFSQKACWRWTATFEQNLKNDLLDHIFNENYIEYSSYKKEAYLSMFTNDINAITTQHMERMIDIVKSSLMMIVYFIFMIYNLGFIISFIIALSCLLAILLPKFTANRLSSLRLAHINALGDYQNITSDLLSGFVHANRKTKPNIMDYFHKASKDVKDKLLQMGYFKTFTIVFNGFVMYILDIIAFALAGLMLYFEQYTIGHANASMNYMKQFIWPIRYIINDLSEINAVKGVITKLENILKRESDDKESIKIVEKISFEDVSVQLDTFTLKSTNLTFERGKKYAIIGHSGSGKSTLFNFITKQLDIENGQIKMDDINLKDINLSELLSGVYTHHHIYCTNALNNITLFHTYSLDKLNDYLKAYPNPKIDRLLCSDDCSLLSQGEKQIIELLRVFVCDTPIILLDEAFSAIDIHNQQYFLDMILNQKDKLILVITHNLDDAFLNRFDAIIHMQDGQCQINKVYLNQQREERYHANR